jgi:hypothetical protein
VSSRLSSSSTLGQALLLQLAAAGTSQGSSSPYRGGDCFMLPPAGMYTSCWPQHTQLCVHLPCRSCGVLSPCSTPPHVTLPLTVPIWATCLSQQHRPCLQHLHPYHLAVYPPPVVPLITLHSTLHMNHAPPHTHTHPVPSSCSGRRSPQRWSTATSPPWQWPAPTASWASPPSS